MQGNLLLKSAKDGSDDQELISRIKTYLKPLDSPDSLKLSELSKYTKFCYSLIRVYAEKVKNEPSKIIDKSLMVVLKCCSYYSKVFKMVQDSYPQDFSRCLIYVVYSFSKINFPSPTVYHILKYYFQIIGDQLLDDDTQIPFLLHVFSGIFVSTNELNKLDVEIGHEIARLCDGRRHSHKLCCILLSKVPETDQTIHCVKRCIRFCDYLVQTSNNEKSFEFFGYFLTHIFNYTMKNCEKVVKIEILQIIFILFLRSNIFTTDEEIFCNLLQTAHEISNVQQMKKIILKILECMGKRHKNLIIKIFNMYIRQNLMDYLVIFDNITTNINFFAKIEISCILNRLISKKEKYPNDVYKSVVPFQKYCHDLLNNPTDDVLKIQFKVFQVAMIFKDYNYCAKNIADITNAGHFCDLSYLFKAICYFYLFTLNYIPRVPFKHPLKSIKEWQENPPKFHSKTSTFEHLYLCQANFQKHLETDSKITNQSIAYITQVCFLLCLFNTSRSFRLFDNLLQKIMTTLKLLTLDSVVKLCLFYKIGSHGANLNPFLEFIASKYPKISQSLECSILKSLGETGQSLTNNLQCIIDGFKASYPVIPKIDQIHFLILLQYLLDCHEEVGHYLAEIKFPIKTRLQCLFLAVKFVDHILQNTDTNSQLRNNPEFVLLNFLCLKKCSKILLNSGCYREANSFILILAQQSYSLRSPLFHYFSLNLLMEYLEPNQTQRPAIQENINDLKPILEHLLNPKFDPTNAEFEPKFLGQLDLNPYYPYCKNTTTQDLFDIKWDTVRKYPDLFIDGFNEINCCNLIGYEKKELNYEINNNNALSTLLDKLVISQKKSHARKAEVDRLFYPSNSVSFKTSLRSFTFTNFSNLGQVEIASCIQLSICLAFYSYHSINLTKHFLEYFNPSSKNAVQEFCILDKPEIHLRDVTNYICDLSEKISKTWTIIHICYFKAQETTETNDYLIITIGVGSQAFAYRKCIKHDIDYETSLKRIVAENDTSSARVGAEYWNHRYLLEERLSNFIEELDNAWFGNMKHIIRGNCSDSPFNDSVNRLFEEFVKKFKKRISFHVFESIICAIISNEENIFEVFKEFEPSITKTMINWIKKNCSQLPAPANIEEECPIILIVDEHLYEIPFESFPTFANKPVTRMPSLYSISLSLRNWKEKLKDGHVYLDGDRCYFVLNPGQNLDRTQKFFEDTFKSIPRWTGLISKPPTENECLAALQNHDLFLYCGHGNGKQYIKNDFLKKCVCKAVPILMGCYSAKLYKYKDGDPMGTVYYYLMTGSPAVVANLWGVTDKDIDQFLNNVLYDILKNSVSVAESVAKNRSICHLKNLNGAAPIVYGIPVKFSFVDYPQPSKC